LFDNLQLDYKHIAEIYGNGATYYSIDGPFRRRKAIVKPLDANWAAPLNQMSISSEDLRIVNAKNTPRKSKSLKKLAGTGEYLNYPKYLFNSG
jgi:hypothetical protein